MPPLTEAKQCVAAEAGPSLALTKYWGKCAGGINLPATPSLGITLAGFRSAVRLTPTAGRPRITVGGVPQDPARFRPFLEEAAGLLGPRRFDAACRNNFPTGAGLASSSSGFAALAHAVATLAGGRLRPGEISALARVGSGSAARAVYAGFTEFPAGAHRAEPLHGPDHWPELRVLVCFVDRRVKAVSSRRAMAHVQATSPMYSAWVQDAPGLHREALAAVAARDLDRLGPVMRQSTLRMFSTCFSAAPALIYWQPLTLRILHLVETLRGRGLCVWETLDAGPQVKLICLAPELEAVRDGLREALPNLETTVTTVGPGPCVSTCPMN